MSIALVITDRNTDSLVCALKSIQPDINIQTWPNIKSPETVNFAVLWKQPKGILKNFKNLKAVTSLGAGVDFILNDPDLPNNTTVHRIVTDDLKQQMAQYVLTYLLTDFRQVEQYRQQQLTQNWQINEPIGKTTIGFLGLGKIGEFVAKQCKQLGFNIVAYTHRSKHEEFTCLHGKNGLQEVMTQSDYIVCLLPLTKTTKNLLNLKTFTYCKNKPLLIQVGRGEQLVEDDLILALDKGLIKHAILDVFKTEPLAKHHQFWKRKDITLTPHIAARSDVLQTAKEIANYLNIHN